MQRALGLRGRGVGAVMRVGAGSTARRGVLGARGSRAAQGMARSTRRSRAGLALGRMCALASGRLRARVLGARGGRSTRRCCLAAETRRSAEEAGRREKRESERESSA
jgi:hypothetical protein